MTSIIGTSKASRATIGVGPLRLVLDVRTGVLLLGYSLPIHGLIHLPFLSAAPSAGHISAGTRGILKKVHPQADLPQLLQTHCMKLRISV